MKRPTIGKRTFSHFQPLEKLFALAALVALHGVAAPNPTQAQAGEVHFSQTIYRDVTMAPWSPAAAISIATVYTNAGGTVTGTMYYALQPQADIGTGPLGPLTNAVAGSTASAVRLTWERVGGATNMLVWRGSATNAVTNWISAGVVTSFWDYGTNAWSNGTPSVTATQVPAVILPGDDARSNAAARRGWVQQQIDNAVGAGSAALDGDVEGAFSTNRIADGAVRVPHLSEEVLDYHAKISEPVLCQSAVFTGGWVEVSAGEWTNSAGWRVTGSSITNDALIWTDTVVPVLYSPVLTGGVSSVRIRHQPQSIAYGATIGETYSNSTAFFTIWGITDTVWNVQWPGATQAVFSPDYAPSVPDQTSTIIVQRVEVWGWSAPENVRHTNDFRAVPLLVDEATENDSPLPLWQFSNMVYGIIAQYNQKNWSFSPASNDVALAGKALWFNDSFYAQSAIGSTSLVFGFNSESLIELHSAQSVAVTPIFTAAHYDIGRDSSGKIALLCSSFNGYRPIVQRYYENNIWTNMPDALFTNEPASRGRQLVILSPESEGGMFRVILTNMSPNVVTGAVNVTAQKFLHLGSRVLAERDIPDLFAGLATLTNSLVITNGGSVTFSGTNTSGGLRMMPMAATNGISRPLRLHVTDGSGTTQEGQFYLQPDGRMVLVFGSTTNELFSALHNNFLPYSTFQSWGADVVKIGTAVTSFPGDSAPASGAVNFRWINNTNLVAWNSAMSRWVKVANVTTNYGFGPPPPP